MKPTVKVFIMTVIGFVVTTVSTLTDFNFAYLAIVTLVFASTYWVKNYFLPSSSDEGVANWKDMLSGIIIAVNMALSNLAAILLTGEPFSMQVLFVTIAGAVVGYFTKTVPQGAKTAKIARERSYQYKKAVMILILVGFTGIASAQGPFNGFFKSADQNVKIYSVRSDVPLAAIENLWLFRPSATLTAVAIDFSQKPALSRSLSSVGMGLSYGKFSTVNEQAYCNFSVNGLLLTSVDLGGTQAVNIGGAVTVDVFNKIIGAGVGYLDKKFMLLTTLSYSF